MAQATYKISDARKRFAEVLERANKGEEIIITKGHEIYARIGPTADGSKREFGPLRHLNLTDDLFDDENREQTTIDADDWNNEISIWQGYPTDEKRQR
jgi:antitoxin (DNA-binding transcriptional repressor) of toxin-antitoxin stability system